MPRVARRLDRRAAGPPRPRPRSRHAPRRAGLRPASAEARPRIAEARHLARGQIDDEVDELARQQARARRRAARGSSRARRAAPPRRTSSRRAASRSGAPAGPCVPSTAGPASAKASLLIGAVAIASIVPARASPTAATMASYAARPASADSWPGGNAASAPAVRSIEPRLAHLEHARIRGRLDGDLGTDPGGIADGDADSWLATSSYSLQFRVQSGAVWFAVRTVQCADLRTRPANLN